MKRTTHFIAAIVAALELDSLSPGALVELVVTGTLLDGSEFVASDCVRLVPPGTGPGVLAVNANLPQAWIDIAPLDLQLDGGGFGAFDRTWPQTTVVTLSAEEFFLGQRFVGWKFDGQFLSRQITTDVTIQTDTQTIDAVFRRAGDITNDQAIDLYDFAMFAVCFGQSWDDNLSGACSNESLASSDLDRNGVIDLRDFSIFALHFGT